MIKMSFSISHGGAYTIIYKEFNDEKELNEFIDGYTYNHINGKITGQLKHE